MAARASEPSFDGSRWRWAATVTAVVVLVIGLGGVPDAGGQLLPGSLQVQVGKRVLSTAMTPSLSSTFSASPSSAVPGDPVTYTARVTNSGATLKLSGTLSAKNAGSAAARVESFFDDVQYHSILENRWVPLAGAASERSGYAPLTTAPITTGLQLTAVGAPATGVTYPTSGDAFVATQLAAGSTASWTYEAELALTEAQIALLLDPLQVDAVRNVVHFEIAAEDGSGRDGETRATGFTKQLRTQSGTARDVVVSESLPGGATRRFDKDTTAALAAIAQGASVTVTSSEPMVAPAAKGSSECRCSRHIS